MGTNIPIKIDRCKSFMIYFQIFTTFGYKSLKNSDSNQEPVLFQVTGYPFCNTSRFTMKKLKAEVDPKRFKMNFIEYLNGYSKDVQDIIDKFRLRQQVDNLTDAERLGSIIDKFTDRSINLIIKPVLFTNFRCHF